LSKDAVDKAQRAVRAAGADDSPGIVADVFETRASFHDDIPAVYLRAYWDTLRDLKVDQRRAALYAKASEPSYLREFYRARVLALRWIENSIGEGGRNAEIENPPLDLARLTQFRLGGTGPASASIDFMRLEQAVTLTEWVSTRMTPPGDRLGQGKTIPVADVRTLNNGTVRAVIDTAHYGANRDDVADLCSLEVDDFVRVSPCSDDPERAQTYGQITRGAMTGVITHLDWETGLVEVEIIYQPETPYVLGGTGAVNPDGSDLRFPRATIDDSPSDMVAGRVEKRLLSGRGAHAYRWFDPVDPAIPPMSQAAPEDVGRARTFLGALRSPAPVGSYSLGADQMDAALAWQETRVVLIQGPPGTGKTQTTAATILQAAHDLAIGQIILVAATTHRAIDELVGRICALRPGVEKAAAAAGYSTRQMEILRAHSAAAPPSTPDVWHVKASAPVTALKSATASGIAIIAGTTTALLKMAEQYDKSATARSAGAFQAAALVVDEASMMVTPHFLALASLTRPDGRILAAGDHRQLRSILKHDWDHEDRPPIVLYEPHESAYRTIRAIARRPNTPPTSAREVGLSHTHRLHADVRALVQRVYTEDGIILTGRPRAIGSPLQELTGSKAASAVWRDDATLYLVVHDEDKSSTKNVLEARIIAEMLDAAPPTSTGSAAIVTPYRSQRVTLRRLLAARGYYGRAGARVDLVDSVERLQGSERSAVFVSAATSDPQTLAMRAAFALNLNRANVAFTRSKGRLVVVCSRAMLDHIPVEFEDYQTAALWKELRGQCTRRVGRCEIDGVPVLILAPEVPDPVDILPAEAPPLTHAVFL